jgi:hypothetical protein
MNVGKYVYENKSEKIEGAMMLRNLFLPTEYTYIKQEVATCLYYLTSYNITAIIFTLSSDTR